MMAFFNWKHKNEKKKDLIRDKTGLPQMGEHETIGEVPELFGTEKPTIDDVPMDESQLEELKPRFKKPEPIHPLKDRELEIISLKLDTIRSTLESVDQRLKRIEKLAYGEDAQKW